VRVLAVLAILGALSLPSAQAASRVPRFAHVVVVVFENKETNQVLGSRAAPTFNLYARTYARVTQYYGISHPSLPNYLALVGGSTFGITSDCVTCSVDAPSLADTVEAAGKTWKVYAEGLPSPGFLGPVSGRYAKKHNPLTYFQRITSSPERRSRIVPFDRLASDAAARALPDLAFVVPDMCDSMHDCPVQVGDAWLRRTIGPLLRLPDTAIFITFDEGSSNVRGGGHVTTIVAGTAVRRRSSFRRVTNHYGLLRTIEDAWRLPRLGASAHAIPITGIWR
jgi:hypothetical protein